MNVVEMLRRMTPGRAILIGLVLTAFYYFVAFDSGSKQEAAIQSTQQQITQLEAQIRENQGKLDRAAVYKKTAAEVGTTIHRLLSVIPERFATTDLMKILSNEAKVAGSSLANITQGLSGVSSVSKEFEELSVTIDLTGSFLQHMTFLANLTKINQIVVVRKLDLSALNAPHTTDEAIPVHMVAEIVALRYHPEVKPGTDANAQGGAAPAQSSPAESAPAATQPGGG